MHSNVHMLSKHMKRETPVYSRPTGTPSTSAKLALTAGPRERFTTGPDGYWKDCPGAERFLVVTPVTQQVPQHTAHNATAQGMDLSAQA